ncbi:14826_t:CDS:2, partial [Cetraspora pellucida]
VKTHLFRRMKQMNLENDCDTILTNLLQRNFNSHELIQQAKQISTIIDMQNLSSEQNKLKMSKRKQQQIEEAIEETSNKHQRTDVSEETYEFYLKQKKWEVTKDAKEKAFNIAFPDKDE